MHRFNAARALRVAQKQRAAQTGPLRMRPPIEPSVRDVKVSETHPLWQFFDKKKQYIRRSTELTDIGSAWSIPQLRRKNFNDLHSLWYVCLKEANRLSRESRLLRQHTQEPGDDTNKFEENAFDKVLDEIKTTMWRIRHVLAERHHAHQRLANFALDSEFPRVLEEFKESYLTMDSASDFEANAKLERFQYAFFGINPMLEGNFPEPRLAAGIYTAANLKLERYGGERFGSGPDKVEKLLDIREAYTLFTAEPSPKGVGSAIDTIIEVRAKSEPVPHSKDVEVLAELMAPSSAT